MDLSNASPLVDLIKDTFRTRPNSKSVYVEFGGGAGRVSRAQHQVIFGRRGSGKSSLLIRHQSRAAQAGTHVVYVDADEIKRLQYPDVLIRLLLQILEAMPQSAWWRRHFTPAGRQAAIHIQRLRELLDRADHEDVHETLGSTARRGAKIGGAKSGISAQMEDGWETSQQRMSEFQVRKLDEVERHLQDYKKVLRSAFSKKITRIDIVVDDFYLFAPVHQPDTLDYLHRLVRGLDCYLKVATVRHRTSIVRYDNGQTIGVEVSQDIEAIDLDRNFSELDQMRDELRQILDGLGSAVGVDSASSAFLSDEGLTALTLASGGVPRDYLSIFVEAVSAAVAADQQRITPKSVYKGAARHSYRTKLSNLRGDVGSDAQALERVFQDLLLFCLKEKRKTAFLVSQDDSVQFEQEHEVLRQLMDFKLVHVIEPDTSAASGRSGRFEAYTLDFSQFMEPRKRGIEIVEFWKVDTGHRKEGIREAPTYPLSRVRAALDGPTTVTTEEVFARLEEEMTDNGPS